MKSQRVKKVGLKLNIQKTKIMASGPMTSWQTDGETMETVTDFILGGFKLQRVTAAMKLKDTCPWKKSYDKLRQNIKKQIHHLADKSPCSQSYAMGIPVVLYRSDSWTTKKAEHQRTDASELWCWRRLLILP